MNNHKRFTRFTLCKLMIHKYARIDYQRGGEGIGHYLRCQRCGNAKHDAATGVGRSWVGGPG